MQKNSNLQSSGSEPDVLPIKLCINNIVKVGLEPTRPCGHETLILARLPDYSIWRYRFGEDRTLNFHMEHEGLSFTCIPNSSTKRFYPYAETWTRTLFLTPDPKSGGSAIPPHRVIIDTEGLAPSIHFWHHPLKMTCIHSITYRYLAGETCTLMELPPARFKHAMSSNFITTSYFSFTALLRFEQRTRDLESRRLPITT